MKIRLVMFVQRLELEAWLREHAEETPESVVKGALWAYDRSLKIEHKCKIGNYYVYQSTWLQVPRCVSVFASRDVVSESLLREVALLLPANARPVVLVEFSKVESEEMIFEEMVSDE